MKLIPVKGLGSPAAIAHDGKCDSVYIDPAVWHNIPKAQRAFILEHEKAHCRYNVFDEEEADRIGFINFVKKEAIQKQLKVPFEIIFLLETQRQKKEKRPCKEEYISMKLEGP